MCDSPLSSTALGIWDHPMKIKHLTPSSCGSEVYVDSVDELKSFSFSSEASSFQEDGRTLSSGSRSNRRKSKLEHDVQILEHQLQEEMQLRAFLESAANDDAPEFFSPSYIPQHIEELLSSIAVLEVTVCKLEAEMVSLQSQLSQERNDRNVVEHQSRHIFSQSLLDSSSTGMAQDAPLRCLKTWTSETSSNSENDSCQELGDQCKVDGAFSCTSSVENNLEPDELKEMLLKKDTECESRPVEFGKLCKLLPPKALWDHPNQLSEEMVRCMKNIFMSLADSSPSKLLTPDIQISSSPHGNISSLWSLSERSMVSSWGQSPQVDIQCNPDVLAADNVRDPYRVHGKLSWADIGNYGLAVEVSWMSVGKKQLEFAAGALRRFRLLVEQLAKVNPIHLSWNEKLAFWINVYNALIMHAYLAYGVPRSELKFFSLLQKAAYTVGGHSISAAAIEYVILKMKPPAHRQQIALLLALHKLKVTEEQRKFAMDKCEPLVAFALSCGMYSSPAVRVYTAEDVREQLQEAQLDFVRASVGISSRGRLLVPKMLHCFAKSYVDDAKLAVWISHHLPSHQATFVEQCVSQRRSSLLSSRNCGILPYDSRFRYLFLPDSD